MITLGSHLPFLEIDVIKQNVPSEAKWTTNEGEGLTLILI
jgi:hypothetical protein